MDNVNHPKHYLVGGIEAIDIIQSRLTKEEFIGLVTEYQPSYFNVTVFPSSWCCNTIIIEV